MRRAAYLVVLAGITFLPLSPVQAEQTRQQQYLDIYLKINDAEHLERQGDFVGALNDFQDCYNKLARIHDEDPNWETALVVHRMEDCKTKILDLEPKAKAQAAAAPPPAPPAPPVPDQTPGPAPTDTTQTPAPTTPNYNGTANPAPANTAPAADSPEVASLKLQLQAVKDELTLTKNKLADSEAQNETYRAQLKTVNEQLVALKGQQSVDDRMGKLLADNKDLTDKLAAAKKELETIKSNPKSKLAMAQAQLKNLQDQYAASQEANKALQDTTTTLKSQLDQAQADLSTANQKLASAGTASPEYTTLKRENEIMRDILTRELQEQAHRDMAKRLAQEEFDNLKLKSKVLQENLDILATPMTPPTNDEERALIDSMKVPGPDVSQVPATNPMNGFSAPASGTNAPDVTVVTPAPTTPSAPDTSSTPSMTNAAVTVVAPQPTTPDVSTNTPAVTVAMNNTPPPTPNTAPDPSTTNAAPVVTVPTPAPTDTTTPVTNVPDPSAPIPPNGVAGTPVTQPPVTPAPADASAPTMSQIPGGQTTYTDQTIKQGDPASAQGDPGQYANKARLPDDMRETAQDAADLFKNQKYDESAAKYQSIIEKYPESLYAWSNLGVVRFQQGKYDDALKALQQAVKLSPTDAFSYSNLGIVYYQLNQYENAIDALNSAKALDPNDAKTHNYLGCAESQKGWQEVAQKEFRKAIEIDPNFGDAHFNLALVYATEKPPSIELARREYNRALELGIAKDDRLEKLLGNTAPQQ